MRKTASSPSPTTTTTSLASQETIQTLHSFLGTLLSSLNDLEKQFRQLPLDIFWWESTELAKAAPTIISAYSVLGAATSAVQDAIRELNNLDKTVAQTAPSSRKRGRRKKQAQLDLLNLDNLIRNQLTTALDT